MKALREGRTPTPGPPGGEEEDEEEEQEEIQATDETPVNGLPPSISEFPSPPSNFTAPLPPSSPKQQDTPTDLPSHSPPPQKPATIIPPAPQKPVQQQPVVVQPISDTYNEINPTTIAAAQKNCKWAISALDYDDVKTARTQLLSALNELGFNQENNFGFLKRENLPCNKKKEKDAYYICIYRLCFISQSVRTIRT
jgi:vacuolar protein sorting-associated protein VTA1